MENDTNFRHRNANETCWHSFHTCRKNLPLFSIKQSFSFHKLPSNHICCKLNYSISTWCVLVLSFGNFRYEYSQEASIVCLHMAESVARLAFCQCADLRFCSLSKCWVFAYKHDVQTISVHRPHVIMCFDHLPLHYYPCRGIVVFHSRLRGLWSRMAALQWGRSSRIPAFLSTPFVASFVVTGVWRLYSNHVLPVISTGTPDT